MNVNNAIWLYSEKPLNSNMFEGLPIYCSKAVTRPYEIFTLFDTYDLELNNRGIILFKKKSDKNKRLYLYWLSEQHTVVLPVKFTSPLTADVLRESALKKYLYDAVGLRPFLVEQPVALSLKTFNIIHADTDETVKVMEKRSANSKSGYYYEFTPNMIELVASSLNERGFKYTTPAEYLSAFLKENHIVKKYSILPSYDVATDLKLALKPLMERASAMLELTFTYGDPKSIHDLRVSLRILKALLFQKPLLYKTKNAAVYKNIFKNLLELTSSVRDGDVFLERLNQSATNENTGAFKIKLIQKRAELLAELKSYCNKNDIYSVLINGQISSDSTAEFPDDLPAFCIARLRNMRSSLKKIYKKIRGKFRGDRAHKTRIVIKNLRYHIELLPGLGFEEDDKELLNTLKDVQTVLGRIHDRSVQKKMLSGLDAAEIDKEFRSSLITKKITKKEIALTRKAIKWLITHDMRN